MSNDRFTVPEVLFNPTDIGINQAGIPEAISQSIQKCPDIFADELYRNTIVSGGNSVIEGFSKRIRSELGSIKPDDCSVGIHQMQNPTHAAWRGLKIFANSNNE